VLTTVYRRNNGFWAEVARKPTPEEKEKTAKYINSTTWASPLEKQVAIEDLGKPREELRYEFSAPITVTINFTSLCQRNDPCISFHLTNKYTPNASPPATLPSFCITSRITRARRQLSPH
jgi:hypothetical protein